MFDHLPVSVDRPGPGDEPFSRAAEFARTVPVLVTKDLDESAQEFVSTFIRHVAMVAGYSENRIATIAHVKALLLSALANDEGACSSAWRAIYQTIAEIVAMKNSPPDARSAHYLQAFIRENGDLARE